MIRRLLGVVVVVMLAGVSSACGAGGPGAARLSIISYRGADWLTDGAIKPPASLERSDRIHYPHNMNGVVLASTDSQTLLDLAGDDQYGEVTRDYFAAGAGLKAYLAARSQLHITGDPNPARLAHIKGFRFLAYSPEAATVEVVYIEPDQSVTGVTRTVVWLGDTWLIQLPDPASPTSPVKAYPTMPTNINALPQT
ncbi:hypothetical protein KO481_16475 [Nocardia sp. NEAU-G5]|uniref:DUF8175 domain-containing protein n=1 Tax=Nocardia albiluteola TaxID=2842303 RepID=A0ABS6AYK1_9NOCA|nr:hypothetical protein [Nocardia albiluteola]MBU3063117.1 hypothetical protein [Nocardia albiluteola]